MQYYVVLHNIHKKMLSAAVKHSCYRRNGILTSGSGYRWVPNKGGKHETTEPESIVLGLGIGLALPLT